MSRMEDRPRGTCWGCNEDDVPIMDPNKDHLCPACYMKAYKARKALTTVPHGKSKAQLKEELECQGIVQGLIKFFMKAQHKGILNRFRIETQETITTLVREVTEMQQEIVGKSDAAILEDVLRDVRAVQTDYDEPTPRPKMLKFNKNKL